MGFSQDFIERVRGASDIVEVIGQYVTLKKRGINFFGLCPFHTEKTPSFSVNPQKEIFYCFGCHTGGNVISFIMQKEKMGFAEAVEFLAKRAGFEIPQAETPDKSSRERLFNAVLKGHHFFREQFKLHALPAQYLHSRGFELQFCEKMELGFAPDSWDALTKTIKSGFRDFITAGLIREREGGGYYDYFRNRLIFPIKDLAGRVCAFGGRDLSNQEETAKYLNSPENPIYSKGSLLYGLFYTREAIRKTGFAYLVEGYTDFLRLFACGIENCTAGLGTALTVEQAKLLHRYTEKVVLLYDGDSAGVDAAVRAARIIISRDLEAEIVAMPREHDPDSLLRDKKRPEFDRLPRLSVFDFHLRQAGGIPETRPEREALAREMLETASCLPGEMKRSLALEEISEKLKMPVDALRSELRHLRRDKKDDVEDHIETTTLQFAPSEIVERDLVKILIALPELGEEVFPTLNPDLISHPALKKIFTSMKSLYLKGEMKDAHNLLPQYEDSAMLNFIAESAFWEIPGEPEVLLRDYVAKMQNRNVRSETTEIRRKIKEAEAKGEDINYLLKRLREMQKKARI